MNKAAKKLAGSFRLPGPSRFSRGKLVAIDFDGRQLRIALARASRGRARLLSVISQRLPTGAAEFDLEDPRSAGAWLAKELTRLGISASHAIMAVPRAKVILKPVRLPEVEDLHELAAMLRFQVSKELPFPAKKAVIDFTVQSHYGHLDEGERASSGEADSASVEVLAAAVEDSVVDYYRELAEAAALKLEALGLRSYAYQHCLELCDLQFSAEGLALVSVRPDEITISVLADNYLTFSRTASVHVPAEGESRGGNEFQQGSRTPESDRLVGALATEVRRSLRSYEGVERHASVGHVLIAGDTGLEEHVVAELNQHLGVSCELFDPGSTLNLPPESRAHARGAVSVIGLASRAAALGELPFNFLSPKRTEKPRDPSKRRKWLGVGAAAALVLLCMLAYKAAYDARRADLEHVNFQIQNLQAQTGDAKLPIVAAAAISKWVGEDRAWLDHWTYLSSVLPSCTEIYVDSVAGTGSGSVTLSVHARTAEILAKLDETLRAAGYRVRPISIAPAKDAHGYGFRGTVELTVPPGMKPDLDKYQPAPRPADDALRSASSRTMEGGTREQA